MGVFICFMHFSITGSIKVFNTENPDLAEDIVTLAYESGINLFDICDPYMADESERQLGRILKKKRMAPSKLCYFH